MRISVLVPHLKISGGIRIIAGYARRLADRGHDVILYLPKVGILDHFTGKNVQAVREFNLQNIKVRSVIDFNDSTIQDGDIVIASNHILALKMAALSSGKGKQVYIIQHEESLYHGDSSEVIKAYQLNQNKITVSTWLKGTLKEKYGVESYTLINPIDTNLFSQKPRTADVNELRIMLLHHTYQWKGTQEGVEIVEAIKKKYKKNIKLILFGSRQKKDVPHNFDEYHYKPPQKKLVKLYSNTDIFLCPSWYEGYGLPSVEAMACGAVLATYDNGGSQDYAFHEKTALVAKNQDKEDLQLQLDRLVSDPELRKRIASAGKQYVRNMPTWEDRTTQLESFLNT